MQLLLLSILPPVFLADVLLHFAFRTWETTNLRGEPLQLRIYLPLETFIPGLLSVFVILLNYCCAASSSSPESSFFLLLSIYNLRKIGGFEGTSRRSTSIVPLAFVIRTKVDLAVDISGFVLVRNLRNLRHSLHNHSRSIVCHSS